MISATLRLDVSYIVNPKNLQELRRAIEQEAVDTKKTPLLLSAKVAALKPSIDVGYEVPEVARCFSHSIMKPAAICK